MTVCRQLEQSLSSIGASIGRLWSHARGRLTVCQLSGGEWTASGQFRACRTVQALVHLQQLLNRDLPRANRSPVLVLEMRQESLHIQKRRLVRVAILVAGEE